MSKEAGKYEPSFVAPPICPTCVNVLPPFEETLTLTKSAASSVSRR